MKKYFIFALCSAFSLSVFATGFKLNDNTQEEPIGDHKVVVENTVKNPNYSKDKLALKGFELIKQMDKIAETKEYAQIFTGSQSIIEKISEIGNDDYTAPIAVYKTVFPKSEALKLFVDEESVKLPDDIKNIVINKSVAAVPSQITAAGGAENLATTSVLSNESSFIYDSLDETQLYIYVYENNLVFVTFTPAEDNIVNATANFVISNELKSVKSNTELDKWFVDNMGIYLNFSEIR